MSRVERNQIIADLMADLIDKTAPAVASREDLLLTVAPEESGTLALGLAIWAMSWVAPALLPQLRGDPRRVVTDLSPSDRMALALLAVRSSEGKDAVREVRADMAALRRMGRLAVA